MIKPGYRTSEFWFTLVSFVFSGLYLIGVINDNSHKEELISAVSHAVESCILIGGQALILYKYINARAQIKENVEKEQVKNVNSKNSNTTNKSRSSKNRSRQTNSKNKRGSTRSKKNSTSRSMENTTTSNS